MIKNVTNIIVIYCEVLNAMCEKCIINYGVINLMCEKCNKLSFTVR